MLNPGLNRTHLPPTRPFEPFLFPYRLIWLAMVVLVLSGCQIEASTSEPETNPSEAPSPRIAVDVGVIVEDMERSLVFYRDLLGLPVVAEVNTSLIGKGLMVQLKHGASLIKLVQMEEAPSAETETGIATTFGYRYITLMVEDMDAVLAKLEPGDVPVALPVTTLGNGAKIYMVEDPDGNIVEFVQEAN